MTTPSPLAQAQELLTALCAARLKMLARGGAVQSAFAGQSTTWTSLNDLNAAIKQAEKDVARYSGRRPMFVDVDLSGGCQ